MATFITILQLVVVVVLAAFGYTTSRKIISDDGFHCAFELSLGLIFLLSVIRTIFTNEFELRGVCIKKEKNPKMFNFFITVILIFSIVLFIHSALWIL